MRAEIHVRCESEQPQPGWSGSAWRTAHAIIDHGCVQEQGQEELVLAVEVAIGAGRRACASFHGAAAAVSGVCWLQHDLHPVMH